MVVGSGWSVDELQERKKSIGRDYIRMFVKGGNVWVLQQFYQLRLDQIFLGWQQRKFGRKRQLLLLLVDDARRSWWWGSVSVLRRSVGFSDNIPELASNFRWFLNHFDNDVDRSKTLRPSNNVIGTALSNTVLWVSCMFISLSTFL